MEANAVRLQKPGRAPDGACGAADGKFSGIPKLPFGPFGKGSGTLRYLPSK